MSVLSQKLDLNLLSIRIRNARKLVKLSQFDLASMVGVSDKAISSYEVGRAVPPLDILKKISLVTNKPVGYFLDEEESNHIVIDKVNRMIEELESIKKIVG
ncbi:MAG: helix-turn-helix transcriptional regulator [bacterium]|nr:helix-turn-helix transcriptional regulator [bacterium]